MSGKPIILLAEDDDNDIFFMRRAFTKAAIDLPLRVVKNGQEAMDYLGGAGEFGERNLYPLPSLVLLDLKMPFLGGFDVLTWLQSQALLKDVPVIVLTSSAEDRDRQKAAALGAKGYFVKPPTVEMVREMAQLLNAGAQRSAVAA